MTYAITRENVLDWLHSFGRDMKLQCDPSAHPYDDPKRAAPFKRYYPAVREAWKMVKGGADELEVIRWLLQHIRGGVECNHLRLMEKALLGKFETSRFDNLKKGFHWVTYQGDFYGVDTGDHLNLPRVRRIANQYLSEEERKLEGAQAIAAQMPNPCTRIIRPIHVS